MIDNVYSRMPLWKWVLLFLAGTIAFLTAYSIAESPYFVQGKPWLLSSVLLLAGFALLGLFRCYMRVVEKDWSSLVSFDGKAKGVISGTGVGIVYFLAVVLIMWATRLYEVGSFGIDLPSAILSLAFFFVVAVGEEIVFRGIIFRMIDCRWGTWVALLVSALIFGFVHITNEGATVWSSAAIAIEAGLMLGLAFKLTDSLWFPIGIHWAWNFMEGPVLGFAVSGGDFGGSMVEAVISGPDFLTGGAFGAEGSIIAAALGLAVSLLFLRHSRKPA